MEGMTEQQAMMLDMAMDGIHQHAEGEDQKMRDQIDQMDKMDEDDFEMLRQKRKLLLVKKMKKEQDWKQLGHGRYQELSDTKEFFNSAKKSSRLICHFYRGVTPRCEIVDSHFEKLAPKHLEARFVKIDAEKHMYLVEKLGIIMMPTIVLVKDGHTEHSIIGFDEMGGTDDFTTEEMGFVLGHHDMIEFKADLGDDIAARAARAGGVNTISIKSGVYAAQIDSDDDDWS